MNDAREKDIKSLVSSLRQLANYKHADASIADEAADLILELYVIKSKMSNMNPYNEQLQRQLEQQKLRIASGTGRRIIQIAATTVEDEADILYALCDDGTLWWTNPIWVGERDVWRKVRDIPQEETPNV